MKAFKVFWKESINGEKDPYVAEAVILAENITTAIRIAESYGEVNLVSSEKGVITEPKAEVAA